MEKKSESKIKLERPCLKLTLVSLHGDILEAWELNIATIVDTAYGCEVPVYLCYNKKELQWIEGSKGLALQRFMSLIPNEFRDKVGIEGVEV